MSNISKIKKPFILKFENRQIKLPDELVKNIDEFWNNAIKENTNLSRRLQILILNRMSK